MNKWKVAFFLSLPITLVVALFALFVLIDNGTSYTYLEVSYNDELQANKVLGNLIVKGAQDYNQQDFLHLLRQEYPDAFIVEERDLIKLGPNRFEFTNNKLSKAR